jgi:uncharacterized membrane protein YgdD (TMEM256/DUF423 family)
MNTKKTLMMSAFFGATAVILGAFGAHALKNVLPDDRLQIWHTGIEYQFYHTIALLAVAILIRLEDKKMFHWTAGFFTAGIFLFSGSLYLLAARSLIGMGNDLWIGAITPIGGLCFIAGWIALFLGALRQKRGE